MSIPAGTYRVRLVQFYANDLASAPLASTPDAKIVFAAAVYGMSVMVPAGSYWAIYVTNDDWKTCTHFFPAAGGVAYTLSSLPGDNTFPPNLGFDPAAAYVAWHEESSGDSALYLFDGNGAWFRMSPTPAPESGFAWSPKAKLAAQDGDGNLAGCSAVKSIETAPGVKQLLLGPGAAGGKILYREPGVNLDNGSAFEVWDVLGSVTLAHPGQIAEVEFLSTDAVREGSRPRVGILLDEIAGDFETLPWSRPDPPKLPASETLYNDRFYAQSNQQATMCRHMQIRFSWPAEDAHNELLSYTIFGAVHQEKRSS